MRKIILFVAVMMVGSSSFAQMYWQLNFEDTTALQKVFIDTISHPNNIWQIGAPLKTIFNSAYSVPNVIVTNKTNHYSTNDTSSFIVERRRVFIGGANELLLLDFYYQLNTDSLTDYGTIEASIDNGISWINLLTQDSTYGLIWIEPKPVLSSNTNGWKHFSEDIHNLTYTLGYSDTLLYRFTFISDSVQTNKEGWMMDNFSFNDIWEGINETPTSPISLSPNPTTGIITITGISQPTVAVYNLMGQKVVSAEGSNEVNLAHLPVGMYMVQVFNKDMELVKSEKIILNR